MTLADSTTVDTSGALGVVLLVLAILLTICAIVWLVRR